MQSWNDDQSLGLSSDWNKVCPKIHTGSNFDVYFYIY